MPDSLADWLRLSLVQGVGDRTFHKLLQTFGLPEEVLAASRGELMRVVTEKQATALLATRHDSAIDALIDKTLAWAAEPNARNAVITLADRDYPPALLASGDAPPVLYAKGDLSLLKRSSLAIVGSRNATPQGIANAESFAATLSQGGVTIVSGLALGIDAAAHRGGLKGRGKTVAVIGTGLDIVYPARNRDLAHDIADQGVIVSEFPLGTPAMADHFPRRNRIISGLARGVLVVEAALRSGSLITARLAGEQGREVFAIPGSIHSPLAKGCHKLIKEGAKLVDAASDILAELGALEPMIHGEGVAEEAQSMGVSGVPSGSAPENAHEQGISGASPENAQFMGFLKAMGFEALTLDAVCAVTKTSPEVASATLMQLELEGHVAPLPGAKFQRVVR
jgi:DNA processing protein